MRNFIFSLVVMCYVNAHADRLFLYTQPYNTGPAAYGTLTPGQSNSPNSQAMGYGLGSFNHAPNWDPAPYTGVSIPSGDSQFLNQFSTLPDKAGSSAVQLYANYVGYIVNTVDPSWETFPIKPLNFEMSFDGASQVAPWGGNYGSGAKFCVGTFGNVVRSNTDNGSVNYAQSSTGFYDPVANQRFAFTLNFYDSRNNNYSDEISFDPPTNQAQVVSHFGSTLRTEPINGSSIIHFLPWTDRTWFGACITKEKMDQAISEIKAQYPDYAVSTDRLLVTGSILAFEIYAGPNHSNDGSMSGSTSELNVWIERP